MVEHICKKCNKVFTKKSTFSYHIKRKTPCVDKSIENDTLNKEIELLKQQIESLKFSCNTIKV